MLSPTQTLGNPLTAIVQEIVRVAQPERVILFGSRSRGDANDASDYDLLVVVSHVLNERQISRHIYRALLDRKIGVAVDAIVVNAEMLNQYQASPYLIYRQALAEGTLVYERN